MKKRNLLIPILPLLALILEFLPYGVRMRFMAGPGKEPIIKWTYYFDLLPYGYGNVFPLITGILTIGLLVLCIVYILKPAAKLLSVMSVLVFIAALVSLGPLMLSSYSWIGALISLCLAGETGFLYFLSKKKDA